MSKVLLKRVGPWSVFKFSLILYLLIFVISMIFLGLGFLSLGLSAPEVLKGFAQDKSQFTQVVGTITGSLLVTYIAIFVSGFISIPIYALCNTIGALIFNLIARMSGGIELDFEEKGE